MANATIRNWLQDRSAKKRTETLLDRVGHLSRVFLEPLKSRIAPATTAVISTSLPNEVNTSGSALSFNGTSDYLITPNLKSEFSTTSVTVELWFKANAPGVILDELGQTSLNSSWHDSQIEFSVLVKWTRVWDLTAVNLGTVSFGTWNLVAVHITAARQPSTVCSTEPPVQPR